jgi:hypothetical protein
MNKINHNIRKKFKLEGETIEIKADKDDAYLDMSIYNWDRDCIDMCLNYEELIELKKIVNYAIKLFNKTPILKDKIKPIKTLDKNLILHTADNENTILQLIKRPLGELTINYQNIDKEKYNNFIINIPKYHYNIIKTFLTTQ